MSAEPLELEGSLGGSIGVGDKRLKHVYEFLSAGNNKKAIAEVEKLVRRQPNFSTAKVLKGLSLIRMGRIDDARQVIIPVIQEIPTDEGTIDALSVCCHELNDPLTFCNVLEAACNKEPSEYLLCLFFLSQVEIEDYQKQHLTALNLYKLYKKPQHFTWAMASLISKFERNSQEEKDDLDMLPVQLVERMCDKFIAESTSPVIEDGILYYYLIALYKLEKWEKLLQVMKDHGYPKEEWSKEHFHELYSTSLTKVNKMDEHFEYLKSKFIAEPDEYDVLNEIVSTSDESQKDAVLAFMNELRENNPSRLVALADLRFCREHLKEDASTRIEEDFEMAIKFGGDKLSFYSDLADSFQLVGESSVPAILKFLAPIYSDTEDKYYDSVSKVIKDVNFEILGREITPVKTAFDRLKRADRCFGKYLACERAMVGLTDGIHMKTGESEIYDQLLIIAASSLIAHYYQYPSSEDQVVLVEDMLKNKEWVCNDNHPKELIEIRNEMSPFVEITDLSQLNLEDHLLGGKSLMFVFITAILLLEYGLKHVSCNASLNILLAKSYSSFGASLSAMKVVQSLGMQQVQWDSLGYLFMFEPLNGGLYIDAMAVLTVAEDMYLAYTRQNMDNVIMAYRFGNLHKISEFLGFGDQLFDSIHCSLVFCERRLLNYLINTSTSADLRMVAKNTFSELDERLVNRATLFDNRDFSVLHGLAEDIDLEHLKEISAEADIHFYNIRISLLFCLTKLVNYLADMEDVKERMEIIAFIDQFDKYVTSWDTAYASYGVVNIKTPILHCIWPPQCQKYREVGCFNVLRDLLGYVKDFLQSEEIDKPVLEDLNGILMTGSLFLLSNLSSRSVTDDFRTLKGLSIDSRFTKLHFILETFSFMRIVLECVIEIDNHKLHIWKMDKKKKGRMAALTRHKKMHQESIGILLDATKKLVKFIDEFGEKMQNYSRICFIRKFDIIRTSEMILKPGFLFRPFEDHYSSFFENIETSLIAQTEDFRKSAQSLVEYINKLNP